MEAQHRFDDSLRVYYEGECIAKTDPARIPSVVIRVRRSNLRYTQECHWADLETQKTRRPCRTQRQGALQAHAEPPLGKTMGDEIPDRLAVT